MVITKIKILLCKFKYRFKRYKTSNISWSAFLAPKVQILGIDNISIGRNCTIGESTLFTINNRKNKDAQLIIGNNSYIGRDNFFSVGKLITVGEYCIFGNKCSFICSDHKFQDPLIPYAKSGNSFEKVIQIGVNCWLGHDVGIIGNIRIGHGSIIGAKALITKDIPPFSMVVGNPSKIIKRYNFEKGEWVRGNEIIESIFLDEQVYLQFLRSSGDLPIAYHASSSYSGDL
ncbi:acyltransferase [Pedobacter sp. P351]|uniref:acyltransferase n=1 Tax=Pedobacter superstes TaxID=3133441 RepID=UPI0030AB2E7E